MKNILFINSSISGENGNSTKLSRHFIAQFPAGTTVTEVNLNTDAFPHLEMAEIGAWMTAESERTAEQQNLAARSDELIAKIQAADVILVGVPMYNFSMPTQLKAVLDRIARAGVTFKYTETGPVGLLDDKPVVLVLSRGGVYANTAADSQVPLLTTFFNFVGLKQLHFVYAEGLNMGPESAEKAISAAQLQLTELAAKVS